MEQPVFSEKEIELIDFINIIWKRKWLIIILTLLCITIAGTISFLIPPKWEIDVLIQPSKFLIQTEAGQYEEIVFVDPRQVASQINQKTYNNLIANELNMNLEDFPKLKAENLPNSNLVQISIKENDIEKGKLILLTLFNHLKTQLDKQVEIEMKGINSQVKSKEIEKLRIEEEIKANKNKLNIMQQRKKEIEKELNNIRKRTEALEEEQSLYLKKKNRTEAESLAMLLYSNEIQQSLRDNNTLTELLSEKKIEEENIHLEIANKEEEIKQLENEIDNLNERKGRIDDTQLTKEPTPSLNPVFPNKKLMILIACIFGLLIFTMLAFFLEYLEKQKAKD